VGLIDDLGRGRIGVDTAPLIYFIEEAPAFLPALVPLFQAADHGRLELVTSAITLLEVLVIPYRAGDRALASRYEALLTRSRGMRMVEFSRGQLRRAAQLCAATGCRTPDALRLTAAIDAGCTSFVTNDHRLPSVQGLRIIQLGSYAERA
jgi:predicted nucleic acid-binding protein